MELSQYRNLANLSDQQWQNLDIHLFIAANFNRYCSGLIQKIGRQNLPSDGMSSLLSLFCDVGYKPLKKLHGNNLNASGERRNQLMLGTLKMIASTRMVEAVIKEFPAYINLDSLTHHTSFDSYRDPDDTINFQPSAPAEPLASAYYAAEHHEDYRLEDQERAACEEEEKLSAMIELVRSHLTPMQYKHLRYAVCDRLSPVEIAEKTGHSLSNVRIMLLNARKKMLEMVPPSRSYEFQSYVSRR